MLMMAEEARLEIHICNHKIFQMSIPNKVTSENNANKGKCPYTRALRAERLWATSLLQGQ